ncbi:MAG TPA: SCO family protein [Candidatus Angelobacter sp.]|nr:SCO family protein [Candidatus Angelobacter sp.]
MRRNGWAVLAATAALILISAGYLTVGVTPAAADNSYWGANYFPNVPLITQDGKTMHFYDDMLRGKIVLINFIYTECGDTCPLETAKLAQVYKLLGNRMGKDIFFYSISVDPKRDTPAVLKSYAQKFHTGPGWYFLTGKKEDIDTVRKKIGMAGRLDEDPLTGHTSSLTLGDEPQGQWMQDSSFDDPHFIATIIDNWLTPGYKSAANSYLSVPKIDPSTGGAGPSMFRTRCAACHTIGGGDGVGPDLIGVTTAHGRDWVAKYILAPDKVLAAQDPIAVALFNKYNKVKMPNLHMPPADAQLLVQYIEAQTAAQGSSSRGDDSGIAETDSTKTSQGPGRN